MTDHSTALAGSTAPPVAKLEPNAIGAAQDTIIGMASSAPAATVGLSLAALAAALLVPARQRRCAGGLSLTRTKVIANVSNSER